MSKDEVLQILGKFVEYNGCLVNMKKKRMICMINQHIESNDITRETIKVRKEEEEWLKVYKNQCQTGIHTVVQCDIQTFERNYLCSKSLILCVSDRF